MVSLDVLDYQAGLERAFEQPGADGRPLLDARYRRAAIKDVRRLLESMAFRFALLDDRPLPEDLDYLHALKAVKTPERAAPVLARRAPLYAQQRRRRLITTYGSLAVVSFLVATLMWLATSEIAVTMASVNEGSAVDVQHTAERTFTIGPEVTRLRLDGTVLVSGRSAGNIDVRLLDPEGNVRVLESFMPRGNLYLRENVYSPQPGEWRLLVDFNAAAGHVTLTVDAIQPAR